MHCSTPKSNQSVQRLKPSPLSPLPNELLLCIYHYVAYLHPSMLSTLYTVCRDWYYIIKASENPLWRTATISAFPSASIYQLQGLSKTRDNKHEQDWKETFIIQSSWRARKAQLLALSPCQPPVILATDTSSSSIPLESVVEYSGDNTQAYHNQYLHQHQHHQHHLQEQHIQEIPTTDRDNTAQSVHEPPLVTHPAHLSTAINEDNSKFEIKDTLSCSLCTYADICMIPQAKICVRTHRNRSRPLMQVLDWNLQEFVDINDTVNCHQDLISSMAVNDQGTLLASCSIDGTVRVWDVDPQWSHDCNGVDTGMTTFKRNLQKHGCPIKPRRLLLGHIGWVNAVAIENTTVVSGGSDHTVRIWDALSGRLIRLIPNLFFNRPVGHGVYTVAIHGSLIGSGSIIEGYQIHDLETGQLMIDMDEPLSSKDHVQFESLLYQQYASRMVITDTVVVTNSKKEGMLCVWDRQTGMFMYRIQVCPQSSHAPGSSSSDGVRLPNLAPMVTFSANDSNANLNRITGDDPRSELTVHTFQINKSGSMLMCTLCNGRVSLIDFGSAPSALIDSWEVRASGHGVLVPVSGDVGPMEQHEEHQCGTLAWVWMRGSQGRNRVVLV